jgi:hypothetical protein
MLQVASEAELVNLTLAIVAINGANRFNIAFRTVPVSYEPRACLTIDQELSLQIARSSGNEAEHESIGELGTLVSRRCLFDVSRKRCRTTSFTDRRGRHTSESATSLNVGYSLESIILYILPLPQLFLF